MLSYYVIYYEKVRKSNAANRDGSFKLNLKTALWYKQITFYIHRFITILSVYFLHTRRLLETHGLELHVCVIYWCLTIRAPKYNGYIALGILNYITSRRNHSFYSHDYICASLTHKIFEAFHIEWRNMSLPWDMKNYTYIILYSQLLVLGQT